MQPTMPRVLGPTDGEAGMLGSMGVRFMIDGDETAGGFSLEALEDLHLTAVPGDPPP